mgnify:CR=1 FL=1
MTPAAWNEDAVAKAFDSRKSGWVKVELKPGG